MFQMCSQRSVCWRWPGRSSKASFDSFGFSYLFDYSGNASDVLLVFESFSSHLFILSMFQRCCVRVSFVTYGQGVNAQLSGQFGQFHFSDTSDVLLEKCFVTYGQGVNAQLSGQF